VLGTRDSRPAMGIFSLTTMVFLPLVAGTTFMSITNGEKGSMFTKQRGVADGHAKLMVRSTPTHRCRGTYPNSLWSITDVLVFLLNRRM